MTLVAQGVGPLMLYNIPARSSVNLEVETLLRILDLCPNVVALKDASGGVIYCQELLSRAKDRVTVLSGDDPLTLPLLSVQRDLGEEGEELVHSQGRARRPSTALKLPR